MQSKAGLKHFQKITCTVHVRNIYNIIANISFDMPSIWAYKVTQPAPVQYILLNAE